MNKKKESRVSGYILKLVLLPFTLLYVLVVRLRNYLYDIGYKKSFNFDTTVVSVGNLSVGGTGKTPMVEYLIRLLANDYQTVTLSRGYGRKTKGFRIAGDSDSAKTIGDEPFQFYNKFKESIHVTVGEERAVAIPYILADYADTQLILLDDAYQHRSVKPDFNILLTDYNRPFFEDLVLPAGRLRESRKGANRADLVVVTKCPDSIPEKEMNQYKAQVKPYIAEGIPVFFSGIKYMAPRRLTDNSPDGFTGEVLLFSGIEHPDNLKAYVSNNYKLLSFVRYPDHYDYQPKDISKLISEFKNLTSEKKCLLTTEKDMVKLLSPELASHVQHLPIYYLPIETYFIKDGKRFDSILFDSVASSVVI